MALDGTAAGLRASIAEWLDDPTLTAAIPDFITMAESRFNRFLRVSEMEARATANTDGEFLALPSDFLGMRSIFVRGNADKPLEQMESGELRRRYGLQTPGLPEAFAISGGQLQFGPVPGGVYTVEMVYWQKLPPLAINPTNWLVADHGDVYLYASLLAAEMRGWNDSRLPMLKRAFDEGMAEISIVGDRKRLGAAPVAPSLRRY